VSFEEAARDKKLAPHREGLKSLGLEKKMQLFECLIAVGFCWIALRLYSPLWQTERMCAATYPFPFGENSHPEHNCVICDLSHTQPDPHALYRLFTPDTCLPEDRLARMDAAESLTTNTSTIWSSVWMDLSCARSFTIRSVT
jgi:hypothetical protein